jgi:hypothetical protein
MRTLSQNRITARRIVAIVFAASCAHLDAPLTATCPIREQSEDLYFPAGLCGELKRRIIDEHGREIEDTDGPIIEAAIRASYAARLNEMCEPGLVSPLSSPDAEVVRLLWLRAFHPAIMIRAERHGDLASITSAELAPISERERRLRRRRR